MVTCKVRTGKRRTVSKVKRHKYVDDKYYLEPCASKIDNHADTTCFGRNFRPIYFTSKVCSVSPFLPEYNQQEDVQICMEATAFDTDEGETLILMIGQGLWFGNRMSHSLINPNQLRHYGIQVCDDPTDPSRQLGISLDDGYFIPMVMNGSTCIFQSRCPTNEELETCSKRYQLRVHAHLYYCNTIRKDKYSFKLAYNL